MLGLLSSAARSCQLIFGGGFWDEGVKKDATALSEKCQQNSVEAVKKSLLVVPDCVLRFGGGEIGASGSRLRLETFLEELIVLRPLSKPRVLFLKDKARLLIKTLLAR